MTTTTSSSSISYAYFGISFSCDYTIHSQRGTYSFDTQPIPGDASRDTLRLEFNTAIRQLRILAVAPVSPVAVVISLALKFIVHRRVSCRGSMQLCHIGCIWRRDSVPWAGHRPCLRSGSPEFPGFPNPSVLWVVKVSPGSRTAGTSEPYWLLHRISEQAETHLLTCRLINRKAHISLARTKHGWQLHSSLTNIPPTMIAQLTPVPYGVSTLVVASVALLILYYLLGPLLSPLRDIEGPAFARYTRLWELYQNWRGQLEHVTVALHEEYGTWLS